MENNPVDLSGLSNVLPVENSFGTYSEPQNEETFGSFQFGKEKQQRKSRFQNNENDSNSLNNGVSRSFCCAERRKPSKVTKEVHQLLKVKDFIQELRRKNKESRPG